MSEQALPSPRVELWQAVILGLVEGITEYLPVSSTGHLIIASSLMGLDHPEVKPAVDAFNIVIQGGAILAVLGLYREQVVRLVRGLLGKDAGGRRLAINLLIAFLPAGVLGPLLDDWLELHLFHPGPVMAALALGGVYMLVVDRWSRARPALADGASFNELAMIRPRDALMIGLLQCVAMWPGTSRSMMTITGGMLVGLPPAAAARFSFLLALPTLGGATFFKAVKNRDDLAQLGAAAIVVGLAVATVSAALAVKWLVGFLTRHGLPLFAWYRFALCAAMLGLWLAGLVRFVA